MLPSQPPHAVTVPEWMPSRFTPPLCRRPTTRPQAVRLLLTSRPEAHISAVLDATFRPMTIQPDDPRHLADLRQLATAELRVRLVVETGLGGGGLDPPPVSAGPTAGGGRAGGARGGSEGPSSAAHRPPTEQELQAAVQVLMKKSEGAFVYLAR